MDTKQDFTSEQKVEGEEFAGEEQPGYENVSQALKAQRVNKKRTEEEVKLLANRIALLKMEEKKVRFHLVVIWSIIAFAYMRLTMLCAGVEENRGD